jgi:hypothetical protein
MPLPRHIDAMALCRAATPSRTAAEYFQRFRAPPHYCLSRAMPFFDDACHDTPARHFRCCHLRLSATLMTPFRCRHAMFSPFHRFSMMLPARNVRSAAACAVPVPHDIC